MTLSLLLGRGGETEYDRLDEYHMIESRIQTSEG